MNIAKMNYPFATGISHIIKEKGLKQVYVAEKSRIGKQELNDMLNGRRLIKVCDIPKITEALGVTVDDIYAAGVEAGMEVRE